MRKHIKYTPAPVGTVFGRLTVIGLATRAIRTRWKLRCVCGAEVIRDAIWVATGHTQSCGCLQRERATGRKPTHGMSKTPEYTSWCQMKERCTNPKNPRWADYGGRGIVVCKRWLGSFPAFFADMGKKPSPRHTLGRIENDGNYEPGNCEWQTPVQQRRNRRDKRIG